MIKQSKKASNKNKRKTQTTGTDFLNQEKPQKV